MLITAETSTWPEAALTRSAERRDRLALAEGRGEELRDMGSNRAGMGTGWRGGDRSGGRPEAGWWNGERKRAGRRGRMLKRTAEQQAGMERCRQLRTALDGCGGQRGAGGWERSDAGLESRNPCE